MFIRSIFLASLFLITLEAKESRKRIIIIDTGYIESLAPEIASLACEDQYNVTDAPIWNDHGTNVAKLVVEGLDDKKYCFSQIAYYTRPTIERVYINALKIASDLDGVLVNMSLSGYQIIDDERDLIEQMIKQKKIVVVAAGNNGDELKFPCELYPVCYHLNTFRVGALDKNNNRAKYSNFGPVVNKWAYGNYENTRGTSFSAARVSNQLLRKRDENASIPSNHPTSKRKRTSGRRIHRTRKRFKKS